MARYKKYDYKQMVLLPISLEEQIVPGTLEFAIHTVVESKMDLSVFDEKFNNDETGRLAYDPKVLLKVVLFGYARGLISSRKIERACQENIIFMALSCGQKPDHSTISTFVSSMRDEILPLFRDVLLVCEEMDLLGGTFFALDGCKLPSNASTQHSGSIEDLKRKRGKLEEKVRDMLKKQQEEDSKEEPSDKEYRDKQIEKFQKEADRIQSWLNENDAKIGKTGREVKSNVTDNDSAKMTSSHGAVQGYNSQALVDGKHQVIIHGEVFGESQDIVLAEPMIDGARENMEQIGHENYFKDKTFTADSGYHSKVNIQKCLDQGLDPYIPDKLFRRRDLRFADRMKKGEHCKRTHYILEDFVYNEKEDHYICPNNKILGLNVKRTVTTGNVYRRYKASEDDCWSCNKKDKCIYGNGRGPKQLMVPIGPDGENLTKIMIKKLESEEGRKIYSRRMAIVEPVFANIRFLKRMDRFTLRTKIKVNIQWLLYCMVHNMEKIANYGFT